jgi:hypothetical protein
VAFESSPSGGGGGVGDSALNGRSGEDKLTAKQVETNYLLTSFPTTLKGMCAFVAPLDPSVIGGALRTSGGCRVPIGGAVCVVRPQRPPKHERVAEIARRVAAIAAAKAKTEAKRPAWSPDYFDLFPQRGTTLDQHTMVTDLPDKLQHLIVSAYCGSKFGARSSAQIAAALRRVWEKNSLSLRVKELFETVETFVAVARQIAYIRTAATKTYRKHSPMAPERCG